MPNIENLTAKVLAIAEVKAEAIIEEANREAQVILEQGAKETEKECELIIKKAEQEAIRLTDLAVTAKKTEIRKRVLAAKRRTISNVFEIVREQLKNMNQNEYELFLWKYLSQIDYSEDNILMIPSEYQPIDIYALNSKLNEAGKPTLTLSSQNVLDGFVLVGNDVDIDNGLEELIDYYRSDLENLIVKRLFGKDVVM